MFHELCGDETLKNVVLVTNMWGEVSQNIGEVREQKLATNFFKPALDKGAQLVRHHHTTESAYDIIRRIVNNQPMALQIQRELVDEGKTITDTAAGEVINKELNEQIRLHQVELKAVQEEMVQALKNKDEEGRKELEEETRKLTEEVDKMRNDSAGMVSNYQEEKRRMEEVIRQMQDQVRQEREKAEAAYRAQMDGLNKYLEEGVHAAAAERQAMMERINHLQHQWDNRPREGGGCLIM